MNPTITVEHEDSRTGARWTTRHPDRRAEDWTVPNQVYADQTPSRELHRRAALQAIIACASEHDGLVHASWVRPLTPLWVDEHMRGNVMSQLSRAGILERTGRHLPSGQRGSRNATKDLPIFRVTDMARLGEVAA